MRYVIAFTFLVVLAGVLLLPAAGVGAQATATPTPTSTPTPAPLVYGTMESGQAFVIDYRISAGDYVNGILAFVQVLLLAAVLVVLVFYRGRGNE